MNFKKILTTLVAGLFVVVAAGTASAAMTSDINLYGASAQYLMWTDKADDFMNGVGGCTGAQTARLYSGGNPDGKNSITRATCGTAGTLYFRVSAEASYGGVCAMNNNFVNVPPYGPAGNTNCDAGCGGDNTKRSMIDEATCNFTTGQCTGKKCVTVTAGASDVPVQCFTQESHGNDKGPLTGTWIDRNFKSSPLSWTGADPCTPLVVPFSFFVNKSVEKSSVDVTNITRDNAELIFSGQVYDWHDLVDIDGTAFDSKDAVACLRHAGSGTHASIDAYLSSNLVTTENTTPAIRYFNNGSSDMMKCVNGSGSTWFGTGAIGYADADQSLSSYSNTNQMTLNGVAPIADNIIKGSYNFYGLQQIYGVAAGDDLCKFANDPDNFATNTYWCAQCELIYSRVNGCEAFPIQYKGNDCPL